MEVLAVTLHSPAVGLSRTDPETSYVDNRDDRQPHGVVLAEGLAHARC